MKQENGTPTLDSQAAILAPSAVASEGAPASLLRRGSARVLSPPPKSALQLQEQQMVQQTNQWLTRHSKSLRRLRKAVTSPREERPQISSPHPETPTPPLQKRNSVVAELVTNARSSRWLSRVQRQQQQDQPPPPSSPVALACTGSLGGKGAVDASVLRTLPSRQRLLEELEEELHEEEDAPKDAHSSAPPLNRVASSVIRTRREEEELSRLLLMDDAAFEAQTDRLWAAEFDDVEKEAQNLSALCPASVPDPTPWIKAHVQEGLSEQRMRLPIPWEPCPTSEDLEERVLRGSSRGES